MELFDIKFVVFIITNEMKNQRWSMYFPPVTFFNVESSVILYCPSAYGFYICFISIHKSGVMWCMSHTVWLIQHDQPNSHSTGAGVINIWGLLCVGLFSNVTDCWPKCSGGVDDNLDFKLGESTEVYHSCSAILNNQMYVFGGSIETKQVRLLYL